MRSCCEPEFDPAQLLIRHDALDSPSTLGIRVPSKLAWGRNSVRELRAQTRHVLGDDGGGSILTASRHLFLCARTIGVPAVDYSGSVRTAAVYHMMCGFVPGVVSVSYEKKRKACYCHSRA